VNGAARIAAAYAAVAAIATVVNIACQALTILLYHGSFNVPVSVAVGTAAGLPVKYLLEKRHIFGFQADSVAHDGRLFVMYVFFGIFTTLLFWGIEYLFHAAFRSDAMRYLGGAAGLALGSYIKYHLDKRFVFTRAAVRLKVEGA
jgi:putative flippase GtrA